LIPLIDIDFISKFASEFGFFATMSAFALLLIIRPKKVSRDTLYMFFLGTMYNVLPFVVKLPPALSIVIDFSFAVVAVAIILPALQLRSTELAKKRNAEHHVAAMRSSAATLKRIDKIATALLAPSLVSLALVLLILDPVSAGIGIGLFIIVVIFMIYHMSEQTYRTTFLALFVNVLVLSILIILVVFDFVLKGRVLLIPLVILGGVPAAIAYVVQAVITRNLYRTKFAKTIGRYVVRIYSMLYWSFFVLIIVLMDVPLVLSFLFSRDFVMMQIWSAGFTPFVLTMYTSWRTQETALKMRIDNPNLENTSA